MTASSQLETWPSLPLEAWNETYATLHMWTQIVGKIRLTQSPWMNHCWQVTLYVTARGLTTSPIPYGNLTFEIDFDFIDHQLTLQTSDGRTARIALKPQSVAVFYAKLMDGMSKLDLHVKIHCMPNEVPDPIRPEPVEFAAASVQPDAAFYSNELREFILPYDAVRQSDSPDATLLEFLQTTYNAAADLAKWDRNSLESDKK